MKMCNFIMLKNGHVTQHIIIINSSGFQCATKILASSQRKIVTCPVLESRGRMNVPILQHYLCALFVLLQLKHLHITLLTYSVFSSFFSLGGQWLVIGYGKYVSSASPSLLIVSSVRFCRTVSRSEDLRQSEIAKYNGSESGRSFLTTTEQCSTCHLNMGTTSSVSLRFSASHHCFTSQWQADLSFQVQRYFQNSVAKERQPKDEIFVQSLSEYSNYLLVLFPLNSLSHSNQRLGIW